MVPPYAPPMEGGSERYCFNLSKRLVERGHEVTIFTSQYPTNTPFLRSEREFLLLGSGVLVTSYRSIP